MIKQFQDINGQIYNIKKELSRGGQGVVYRTNMDNIVIKLPIDSNTQEPIEDENLNDGFEDIRTLPVRKSTNITLPLATLKKYAGYTMLLLDDMNSFENVFDKKQNKEIENTNEWLKSLEDIAANGFVDTYNQYIHSGGKRKRILAYLKSACILSELHGKGLVYCDFSSKNAFYSTSENSDAVWLIDADNLNYQSKIGKLSFYTPGYGAPEVIKGQGCTFYSDCYAFAISLFWQLTWTHPFEGRLLDEGEEEDDFLDDARDRVYSGDVVWINDEDDTNEGETVICQENIISKDLFALFERTFSETGRYKRITRPTIFEWSFELAKELDNTVKCSYCEMDYLASQNDICPWCDNNEKIITVKTYTTESLEKSSLLWSYSSELENNIIHAPLRLLNGFRVKEMDLNAFDIEFVNGSPILSNTNGVFLYNKVKENVNSVIFEAYENENNILWIEVSKYES